MVLRMASLTSTKAKLIVGSCSDASTKVHMLGIDLAEVVRQVEEVVGPMVVDEVVGLLGPEDVVIGPHHLLTQRRRPLVLAQHLGARTT